MAACEELWRAGLLRSCARDDRRDDLECGNARRGEDSGRKRFGQCPQHILVKSGGTSLGGTAHSHRFNGLLDEPLRQNRGGSIPHFDWVLRWIKRLMRLFVVWGKSMGTGELEGLPKDLKRGRELIVYLEC